MELKDLNDTERVCLAALVRFAVWSDGQVTEHEAVEIDHIAEGVGEAAYQAALSAARGKVTDMESLEDLVKTVERQEARELIYGTLIELSVPDSITSGESELLDIAGRVWGIEAKFADPEDEGDEPEADG